jgi:hypothetical protein
MSRAAQERSSSAGPRPPSAERSTTVMRTLPRPGAAPGYVIKQFLRQAPRLPSGPGGGIG